MEQQKVNQILEVIEGISLNEWNKLKDLIDKEFNLQARRTKFVKQDTFEKYLKQELPSNNFKSEEGV